MMEAKQNDRWRMWFESNPEMKDPLTGMPVAYAVLEVQITKRIVIPSIDQDRVGGAAARLEIPEAAEVIEGVRGTPLSLRPYVEVDWTDAPNGVFSAQALEQVVQMNENILTWRIEGDLIRGVPLCLVVNVAGMEWRTALSAHSVDAQFARWSQKYAEAVAISSDPNATDPMKQGAEIIEKTLECIAGGEMALKTESWGAAYKAFKDCQAAYDAWMAAKDAAEKVIAAQKARDAAKAGEGRGNPGDGDIMIKVGPGLWQT